CSSTARRCSSGAATRTPLNPSTRPPCCRPTGRSLTNPAWPRSPRLTTSGPTASTSTSRCTSPPLTTANRARWSRPSPTSKPPMAAQPPSDGSTAHSKYRRSLVVLTDVPKRPLEHVVIADLELDVQRLAQRLLDQGRGS